MGPKLDKLERHYNDFQIETFINLVKSKELENIIFSPYSFYIALCILLNGTVGEASQAIRKYLHIQDSLSDSDLNNYNMSMVNYYYLDEKNLFSVVNAIFTKVEPRSEFVDIAIKYYNSSIFELESVNQVNTWVSEKTKGKITKIIENIDETKMIIVSTLYFLSEWKYPFEPDMNEKRKFLSIDNQNEYEFMNQKFQNLEDVKYYSNDEVELITLPYKLVNIFGVILLPKKDELNKYLLKINEEDINKLIKKCKTESVRLTLPKFKIEFGEKLQESLKSLGLGILFNGLGDFSNCSKELNNGIQVNIVVKYFLEVNEKGTEAAAVTLISLEPKCKPKKETVKMIVDRPFLYLLIDKNKDKHLLLTKVEKIT
jgi:serine protease inhibitor